MMSRLVAAARAALLSVLLLVAMLAPALAADSRLAEFLGKIKPADLVDGADRFGAPEGTPPVAPVFQGDRLLGFAYLNSDVVDSTGYSGKPIHILVALDPAGKLIGAKLMEHHEPIVLVGIPEEKIRAIIDHFRGTDIRALAAGTADESKPDIVSGATVTVLVIGDSIMRSALKVVQARGLGQPAATVAGTAAVVTTVDLGKSDIEDWQTLLGDGSVRRLHLSVADINDAYGRSGNAEAAARPEKGPPDDTFIDLYAAPATIPTIGRSLLGEAAYAQMMQGLQPGQQAIVVMGAGSLLLQGIGLRARRHLRPHRARPGTRERPVPRQESHAHRRSRRRRRAARSRKSRLFVIPPDRHFDPAQPWQLQLLVQRAVGALEKAFLTFDLRYLPPEKYLKHEQPAVVVADAPQASTAATPGSSSESQAGSAAPSTAAEAPLWQRIWKTRWFDVGILMAAIGALTVIFFFQDWFMRRPRIFVPLRLGFLAFVLVWLGWLVHAQPSVVNVLTYVNALMSGFKWDYFLMDPLLFILWVGIAAALLFWGRGPFCGWLCPFGALQELTNKAARRLKVPQITVPWGLHERLWPIKYIIFLGLFGVSIYSLALGEQLSEIEPFKTAIVLRFVRDWPFVVFAGALLVRRPVHRALLLPLPLPARRRPGDSRPAPDVRLAEALPRMRQPVPALRRRMPGPGDPPGGSDQRQRVHLLHALPTALLGRSQMPGDDPTAAEARAPRRRDLTDHAPGRGRRSDHLRME